MGSLSVNLCGIELDNPVIPASGTFGYGYEFAELYDINCLGTFSFKGTTKEPRFGNPTPRIAECTGGMINAVGLQNPGVDKVISEELPKLKACFHKPVMANVSGFSVADYAYTCERLDKEEQVGWLEVNVSCPNVRNLTHLQDKETLKEILRGLLDFRRGQNQYRPILLKISPDLTTAQLDDVIALMQEGGIDGIVATNTTTNREGLETDSRTLADIGNGGVSGAPLTRRSLETVRYIHEKTEGRFPIIGVGGIMTEDDAVAMLDAGADLIQVYTGFIYNGPAFVKRICKRLRFEADKRSAGEQRTDNAGE